MKVKINDPAWKIQQKMRRAALNEGMRQEALIDKYLRGQMTQEEECVFMAELNNNPDFKERAICMAWMIKGIKSMKL